MATTTKGTTVEPATATVMNSLTAEDISAIVDRMLAEKLAKAAAEKNETPIVDATIRGNAVVRPKNYLEHYRNEVSPDCEIQMREIDDEGNVVQGFMKGRKIRFRRGHFFATKEDEVRFLDWLMRTPALDPHDNTRIMGGNPNIYVADGKELTGCPYCNEPFVIGSNALKAHIRATHGIT